MPRLSETSLAVIGSGIAGLTAAQICHRAGMSVTVFDKGRGVGGRCATRRRDDFAFDHGAQLIGATDGDFKGVLRKWMIATKAQRWKGQLSGRPARRPHALCRRAGHERADPSNAGCRVSTSITCQWKSPR